MAVISVASMTARRRPFSVSNSSTTPWCESNGVATLPAKTLITFIPITPACGSSDGIEASRPCSSGRDVKLRSGMTASPLVRAARASAITSMHSAIGRRRRTS